MLTKTNQTDEAASEFVTFKKADAEEQIVFGEVYAPDFPDSQGDFKTAAEVKAMAYRFMKSMALDAIDIQHNQQKSGASIVESFIARDDDTTFIPGSWVIGVHIPDEPTWNLVKSGELNGFSLDGVGYRHATVLEFDIPERLSGATTVTEDHEHTFEVAFSPDGTFLGGRTLPAADGHYHLIKSGTATEVTNGHSHRFSFVEGIIRAQNLV